MWQCIKQCGACCYLDPEERPDLEASLTPQELAQYLRMVGEDGWCVRFDPKTRECSIYEDRPAFCRVTLLEFQQRYGIAAEDFDDFAIACCRVQIDATYGERTPERERYDRAIATSHPA